MTVPRAAHSATALGDGRVLIVGGCTLDSCEMGDDGATAELFDPVTDAFSPAGRMETERVSHSATLLPDGRVLIAGGFDGTRRLASAELYDPTVHAFTLTGDTTTARGEHAAAVVPDGRVLVVGGNRGDGDVLASAELFDPTTGTFTATGEMSVVRHKHAAVSLPDGRVLVVGGSDARDGGGRYASTELYDPANGTFETTASMTDARYKLAGAVITLADTTVLIAGGGSHAEVFDPANAAFRPVEGNLGAAWAFATATLLPDGRVLIVGGYDASISLTAGAWLYRPD